MDQYLFDYLLSGKAWLLIGSGPSTEMGYPSWEHLAAISIDAVKTECVKVDPNHMQDLLTKGNYPKVFSEAKKCLGDARLRQILADNLKPTKDSSIYKLIAQWPVDVYMTTNFDDEIQRHLANLGLAYIKYSNSEDHLSQLVPDFSGAIMKLHGDLTEEKGLVLSEEDYQQISESLKNGCSFSDESSNCNWPFPFRRQHQTCPRSRKERSSSRPSCYLDCPQCLCL
jgi:hypothetical protein